MSGGKGQRTHRINRTCGGPTGLRRRASTRQPAAMVHLPLHGDYGRYSCAGTRPTARCLRRQASVMLVSRLQRVRRVALSEAVELEVSTRQPSGYLQCLAAYGKQRHNSERLSARCWRGRAVVCRAHLLARQKERMEVPNEVAPR